MSPMLMAGVERSETERIRDRFARLRTEWKEQSRFLSNTAQMALLPSYQRIIGLGPAAVPLILEELEREPDHWFLALEAITDEDPVPLGSAGNLREMAAAWLTWGALRRLLA